MIKLILIFAILFTVGLSTAYAETAEGKPIWETGSDKVCGDRLCSDADSKNSHSIAYQPPLRQIASGILPSDVTCSEGLTLIFKQSNHMPACVKAKTAQKLAQRGWSVGEINSFEECVAAGNPIMESHPRQCRSLDGKHFVESLSDTISHASDEFYFVSLGK